MKALHLGFKKMHGMLLAPLTRSLLCQPRWQWPAARLRALGETRQAIMKMAADGLLCKPDLKDTDTPQCCLDRQKMVNILELMQNVTSAEEQQILMNAAKEKNKEDLLQAAEQLQRKCVMDQMCMHEQIDPETERKNKHSKRNQHIQALGTGCHTARRF
jgi:hypothetical protein